MHDNEISMGTSDNILSESDNNISDRSYISSGPVYSSHNPLSGGDNVIVKDNIQLRVNNDELKMWQYRIPQVDGMMDSDYYSGSEDGEYEIELGHSVSQLVVRQHTILNLRQNRFNNTYRAYSNFEDGTKPAVIESDRISKIAQ